MSTALDLFNITDPPDERQKKELVRFSAEQYTRGIDEAIARVEAGDFYTEEVERMANEW